MTAPTPAKDPYVDNRPSVLVTEASKMYCDLLSMAFLAVPDRFHVVATAFTTADILAHVREHRPSVAIISDNLADGPLSGLRILPEVRKANPETRILLAMSSSDRELVIEAFRFGADGVFCRNSPFDMLCKSVDALAKGQIWANSKELRYVMEEFMRAPKQRKVDPTVENRMTKREGDVVRLAVEGLSNREIAAQLGLTEHTVKNYLFRVFDKLGVSNRVELVLSCLRQEETAREEAPVAS
ncbi:MAG TPA: response regulator transcription factor [Candidatus Eremiobacteraceae bacterium]|jgi:DNA-binding NarL/FixJ family response regulator|nr:response regulator transcription factor [Candidatus Eremiobacteraceae bacterium]